MPMASRLKAEEGADSKETTPSSVLRGTVFPRPERHGGTPAKEGSLRGKLFPSPPTWGKGRGEGAQR